MCGTDMILNIPTQQREHTFIQSNAKQEAFAFSLYKSAVSISRNTSERLCYYLLLIFFTVISWDGFSGVRVVTLPGDVNFAVNHGVYVTDAEVRYSKLR